MKHRYDTLWAPWRMAYIDNEPGTVSPENHVPPESDPDCFLCQAVFDTSNDRERHVLRRTELTISVLNKFPYNNGHLLVAPRRHCGRLDGLTETEQCELLREIDRWVRILEKTMNPNGFNIGLNLGHAAGAGLPGHLHWHIVPRWNGDTNYMTTVGSTKVIPQALDALRDILTDVNE